MSRLHHQGTTEPKIVPKAIPHMFIPISMRAVLGGKGLRHPMERIPSQVQMEISPAPYCGGFVDWYFDSVGGVRYGEADW